MVSRPSSAPRWRMTIMRRSPATPPSRWCGASPAWASRAAGPGRPALRIGRHLHGRQRILQDLRDRRRRAASGRPIGGGGRARPDLRIRGLPEIVRRTRPVRVSGAQLLRGFADPVPLYRVVGAGDLSSWQVRKMRSVSRFVRAPEWRNCGMPPSLPRRPNRLPDRRPRHRKIASGARVCPGPRDRGLEAHRNRVQPKPAGRAIRGAQGVAALRSRPRRREGHRIHGKACRRSCSRRSMRCWTCQSARTVAQAGAPGARQSHQRSELALVENLARQQRTVLLIEDLHWLDRASAPVVAALASLHASQLLLTLTSRPTGAPDWLQECSAESFSLRPLDEPAGWAMLDAILGPSSTTFELKSRIIRHTANVPLFVEEVCRRLKESEF